MLQRGQLLPSGAFEVPNPNIPFAELGLAVVEEFQEWPAVVGRPRWTGLALAMAGAGESVVPPGSSVREAR
ncbi:hypothetical protein OSH52_24720, partial [Mycobacterium ulcerans]